MLPQAARKLYDEALVIDGLNVSNWDSPAVYESLRAGEVTAINATIATWEGFAETLDHVSDWTRRFRDRSDSIVLVETVEDILEAKRSGRTGIILGWQNATPIENDLDRLGLRIEAFGPTTFIVREVPALLAHVDPSVLAREVIEALAADVAAGGGSRKKNFSDLAAHVIDRMACRGAVKAGRRMSNEEIEHLVSECLELDILFTCPHGRPITLVLPKEEVERRFLRR